MTTRDGGICPYRIIDDFGAGFGLGSIMGCVVYFIKGKDFFLLALILLSLVFFEIGSWDSPRKEKFWGGIKHVKNRAPQLGGAFAAWAGIFGVCQCVLMQIRNGKDDIFNEIIAGGTTGGILNIRGGWSFAARGASSGALFLGLFGVYESVYMKTALGDQIRQRNAMMENQINNELFQIMKARPGRFFKKKIFTFWEQIWRRKSSLI
jgi:Tim17/Tim22/Tim23/Pmp24 family